MKTAQGAITVDVSKFNTSIESAKARLASFSTALENVGRIARTAFRAFDMVAGISERISAIANGGRDLQRIFNALPSVVGRVSQGFANLKTFVSQVGAVISKIPPVFRVLGASAVAVGASIFIAVKALQGISSVAQGAVSSIGRVASAMTNLVKSAGAGVAGIFSRTIGALAPIARGAGIAIGSIGLAIGALDRFFKIGITSAIELGDEFKTLSARTGASIPFLFDMQKLFKQNGINAQTSATALLSMQRSLTGVNADGEPTNDMFQRLGLNVDNLLKMTPEQQFKVIGTAIGKLGTSAEQTAAAFSIFGRQGGSLKAVFKDAGFQELGTKQSQLGVSLAKNADNFSKISAKLRDSGSFFRGFFVEMAGAVAPSILELFKLFEGGDMLTGFGAKLGQQIKFGADALVGAFKTGSIFSMLKSSFDTAVIVLQDLLERTFVYASNIFKKLLEADVATGFLKAIGIALLGSLSLISGLLVKAFAVPLAFFAAGFQTAIEAGVGLLASKFPKVAKAVGLYSFTGGGFGANFEEQRKTISGFGSDVATAGLQNIASSVQSAIGTATDGFQAVREELTKFPAQGEKARNATAELVGKLGALAVAGRVGQTGVAEVAGAEVLADKTKETKKGSLDAGVSSLQRIGGGGGAFGGDPLVKINQEQLQVQKDTYVLLRNRATGEKYMGVMPNMPTQTVLQ